MTKAEAERKDLQWKNYIIDSYRREREEAERNNINHQLSNFSKNLKLESRVRATKSEINGWGYKKKVVEPRYWIGHFVKYAEFKFGTIIAVTYFDSQIFYSVQDYLDGRNTEIKETDIL